MFECKVQISEEDTAWFLASAPSQIGSEEQDSDSSLGFMPFLLRLFLTSVAAKQLSVRILTSLAQVTYIEKEELITVLLTYGTPSI